MRPSVAAKTSENSRICSSLGLSPAEALFSARGEIKRSES